MPRRLNHLLEILRSSLWTACHVLHPQPAFGVAIVVCDEHVLTHSEEGRKHGTMNVGIVGQMNVANLRARYARCAMVLRTGPPEKGAENKTRGHPQKHSYGHLSVISTNKTPFIECFSSHRNNQLQLVNDCKWTWKWGLKKGQKAYGSNPCILPVWHGQKHCQQVLIHRSIAISCPETGQFKLKSVIQGWSRLTWKRLCILKPEAVWDFPSSRSFLIHRSKKQHP